MLKSTVLFIGLLTEVSHLNPEFSQDDLRDVAEFMACEPEFKNNPEINRFISVELRDFKPIMLKAKKAAYKIGLRPENIA